MLIYNKLSRTPSILLAITLLAGMLFGQTGSMAAFAENAASIPAGKANSFETRSFSLKERIAQPLLAVPTFYMDDPAGFNTAVSSLTFKGLEDFESSTLTPNTVQQFDDPLAPGIPNSVFPAGTNPAIGLTLQSNNLGQNPTTPDPHGTNGLVTASQGFLGTPTDQVGNTFEPDSLDLIFSLPGNEVVKAVSFIPLFFDDVGVDPTDTLTVRVYDPANNFLGSSTIVGGDYIAADSFVGVVASGSDAIGRINLVESSAANDYVGVDDVRVYSSLPIAISATKTDTLAVDNDNDGAADPGDTIGYTVIITNTGFDPATGVVFTDTIDPNTTLVAGSVTASPVAGDDTYPQTLVGNVSIDSSLISFSVLSNDFLGLNQTATITAFDATSTQGGNVVVNADGTFTYNPPPGFEGTDTFNYTISSANGSNTATVSLPISGMVWFINNNAAACTTVAAGCGRLSNPFSSLAAFNTLNNGTGNNPAANDNIFIYESATAYTGGITLLSSQRLIGQDATQTLAVITGLTPPSSSPSFPAMNTGGSATTVQNSGGSAVTLNQNNTIRGLTISGTRGAGIIGTGINALTVGADVSLTGVVRADLDLSGAASGTVSFGATITNSSSRAISIQNRTGGTVSLTGAISDNGGTGVLLNSNTGATITFSGGLSLSTGTNAAFTATGGGTVNVCDENPCNPGVTGGLVNSLTTTTGIALNVTNTNIGSNGLEFRSITANGAANGIVLNTTGSSGGLRVTGNGGTCTDGNTSGCSGGTIANMTGGDDSSATPVGTGIVLNNTTGVSLTRMWIHDNSNYGIRGTNINGFNLDSSVVNGVNGNNVSTPFNEGSLVFFGVTGVSSGMTGISSITNSTILGGYQRNIAIDNSVGTLNLTVNNNIIRNTSAAAGDDGLFIEADTVANVTAIVTNNTFAAHGGDHFNLSLVNSAVANLTFTGNALSGGHVIGLGQGIFILGATFNGTFTYNISNNGTVAVPFTGNRQGGAIHVNKGSGTGTFSGRIENNVIGNPAVTGSGSSEASGIIVGARGAGGSHTTLINNNLVRQYFDRGIVTEAGEGSAALNATITNNTVSNFADATNSLHGIHMDNGILGTDSNTVCLSVSGNSVATSGNEPQGGADIRLRKGTQVGLTVSLPGLVGNTGTDAQNKLITDNPTATTVTVTGSGFSGGAACQQPAAAVLPGNLTLVMAQSGRLNSTLPLVPTVDTTGSVQSVNVIETPMAAPPIAKNTIIRHAPLMRLAASSTSTSKAGLLEVRNAAPMLSGENINFSIGTLPANESLTIRFNVTVDDPFPAGITQVCNQSTILSNELPPAVSDDPDTGAANDPTCTPISIEADLSITKTDGAATEIPGTAVTYTIVASNAGPYPDPTALVVDIFPATITGVTWTCVGAGSGTCPAAGAGNINTTVNLPVGGSVTFTASGTIDAAATGTLVNTATVTPTTGITDPVPANNSATDTDTLTPEADLSITKTDGPDPTLPGNTLLYTVTVTNNGPSPAQGVIVTDTLPAGVTLVATSGCLGDPAGVPTCTLGDIPALNSAQFTIEVTVDIGTSGTITNTANVSSSTPDPNPGNNTASTGTTLLEIDFGDAPDPTYPTLLTSNGARHLITGPFLGAGVDGESDGQPNATATGDDGDGNDDEDGVIFPGGLVAGSPAAVDVVASAACTLSAWVDFNANGDWVDAGEDIFPGGTALVAGNNSLSFAVPAGATLGTTVARFRCTTVGVVSFTGLAADGEVEDYQVEIVDNQFSIGDVTALEGNSGDTLFLFTVTRTTNSTAASVTYATSDGSAVAGLDYTAVPSTTINFSAGGALTQTAVVTVTGDLMFEADETFTVILSTPVNGDISDGEAIGTILNEDAPPTLNVAGVTNFETAGSFPFTVTLSAVSGLDASVSYNTSDGTAAAGSDYTATSGSLTIPAGSATGVITVTVLDDALPESTETFTLTLSSPVSATIGSGTAVGTIIDDENPPNIISVTDVTAGEAAGLVTFTLSLDTVSGSDVLVDYATNDGPAAAGQDYTAVAGTLTIANGTLSHTVSVPILDDNLDELTETFTLDLSNALNAVILDAQGIGTILDDDESPIATNDAYTTTEDTALTVPAPGLLANDSDGDGDGLTAVLVTPPTNGTISLNADGSFTYTPTLNFSGSDSFTYQASDGANNSNTADVTITVLSTKDPGLIYLPIIFNNHVQLPDLVVEEINVLPGGEIEVVITNQGQAPVGDNFWVDLYINPDPLPTAVNQIWTQLADEGLVWGVDDLAALTPGGTLVLSSQDADAQYSNYSGSLAGGTVIAVQVDSANVETDFGGVLEEHESLGEPYNNILVVTVE